MVPLLFSTQSLKAQLTDAMSSYTPYSLFGIGEISKQGNAYNLSMGGIGIGMRDNRFINYLNPAAISERDTLAFMLDFNVNQKNSFLSSSSSKTAYNVFNMYNFVFTAPIYKKSAFVVGIVPYSNVGYKFEATETDPNIVANLGDIKYRKYGTGGISKLFIGGAATFARRISLGVEGSYYFGTIDRHSDILFNSSSANHSIETGWDYVISSFSAKFGLQYAQPIGKQSVLTIGGTYSLGNNLKGSLGRYAFAKGSSTVDTVVFENNDNYKLKIASEMGVGVSFKVREKWSLGFDYVRQNWKNSTFATYPGLFAFNPTLSESFRVGFEVIPNRYDIRYYLKRVTYRGGAYFDKSYISLNGHQVNSMGITFGASFPIYRWYNAFNIAVDLGQRGSRQNEMVMERYVNLMIGVNLHDIWFQKYRYE